MAGNISLADINTFTIQAPNKKDIIYNFCPQESWVLKGLFWSGKPNFEKDTADIFFERAVNARTILDIGANIGYYTYLSAAANNEAKIIAFEPIDYLADKIKNNTHCNAFNNNVVVFNKAISNKKGIFPFYISLKSAGMSTLVPEENVDMNNYREVTAEAVILDEFIIEKNITNIDLIKIDVEEHELEALEGMANILKRDKPDIICEILPVDDKNKEEKRNKMQNIFKLYNYKWYWISPRGLVEEKEIMGHQVFNANYLFTARS